MFVRKKKNSSGSTSVQIIQKVQGKYSVIKTLGSSKEEEKIDHLFSQAQEAIPRLFNQITLFDDPPYLPRVDELSNDDIRIIGPELVFGKIFNHIGFGQIPDQLFKDLVISRITHPGSKLQLSEYLRENNRQEISADNIYYFLDKLNSKYKHQVEDISFAYTRKLLNGKIGIVFYDMTTIYFESSQPDELRMTGFSKDGKHQHPQIFLGLLVGRNGYPIGYDIFEGNIYEGHTLIPILEKFEKRFKFEKPIVVADAGLLSTENISTLTKRGYTFILGARIKNEANTIKKQIEKISFTDVHITKLHKPDKTILYVSYSSSRAKKDKANRERGLKRLEKSLKAGRLTKSNINNRGYNKYLKMEGELSIQIDYTKFESDCKWDGLKGYITNTRLKGKQVIDNYNNLWKIEKAFRISKTDLKIRPIYHRLKERIEAHICISFVSYVLFKDLERILLQTSNISINKAIKAINKMYEIIVPLPGDRFRSIKLKNNETQKQIIDLIDANY
ncbi:MAG: IS1634 family transposase [Bacteroidales bacterium]|nr:IS1634 family transposase [Bacteroidales bacterium]MCF8391982.1 IS1634 family transposase [Bacteroidales bacterium]